MRTPLADAAVRAGIPPVWLLTMTMPSGEVYRFSTSPLSVDTSSPLLPGPLQYQPLLSGVSDFLEELDLYDLSGIGAMTQARVDIASPLPHVLAHQATLAQAVTNLLSNAIKFVAPGVRPEVRVRAEEAEGRVRLWVEDNGIGIPADHAGLVFEVFTRLHGADAYPGTGLGLAIVRRGIEHMGGQVGVESEPGKGSRFWVELPAAQSAT